MVAAQADPTVGLEEVARELFEVLTQFGLTAPLARRRPRDLKEIEFHTLALLHGKDTMIVGEIQRLLGVLPAQMSRIIRALEDRERPLIACHINPRDKRKVNVQLTPAGTKALHDYELTQVGRITGVLRNLPDDVQEDLARLLDKMRMRAVLR